MKFLAISLLILPFLAVTPAQLWQAVASAVATLITGGVLIGLSWKWVGSRVYKAFKGFFQDHHAMREDVLELKKEASATREANDAHFRDIRDVLSLHTSKLAEHGEAIAFLRGKEAARQEIAANTRALGQIVENITHQEEPPHEPS